MLKTLNIESNKLVDTGFFLFKRNPVLIFTIQAPIYWWLDSEVVTYERDIFILPTEELSFCFDTFAPGYTETQKERFKVSKRYSSRQWIQKMPLGTLVTGNITLTYRQIVEICENYVAGEYDYHGAFNEWDNEKEWNEFCEELFTIRGISELVRR